MQLTAIGKVELSQPAIVNCEMVAVLSDWMKSDVQPAARRHLGAQVTRIEVLSSYSCRNAYGRKKSRLSEHGRANAIDIKGFALERGAGVDLMAHWGLTERDIKARIAAAEAAAKAHAAAKAKADAELRAAHARSKSAPPPAVAGTETRPTANGLSVLRGMVPDGIARPGQGDGEEQGSASTLTLGQPSRLGGPKAKNEAPVAAAPAGSGPIAAPKSAPAVTPSAPRGPEAFLRQIHEAACKRFGTVLGPEANEAHRNHFHLDLAERNRGNYCE